MKARGPSANNRAVSECGPTLKAINATLTEDARQARAAVSPIEVNILQLEFQNHVEINNISWGSGLPAQG